MEADHISTLPVSHVENSQNEKKDVSFNIQSNILYFNKDQSSSFLEGMEADNISTVPDSHVENSKNINSNNVTGAFCNTESQNSFADDVDLEQSKLNVEKPHMLLKSLVINLEKLPLNILNKFNGRKHVCDEGSKNALSKKPKADISPNSLQTKTQCINQNGDIHTAQTINAQDLEYNKDTIQTITSDSLLTKLKTFRELKVSLQLLPDNLLTLDKINLKNLKQFISSSSVKPANNQCSDQKSLKRPKHKVSKSKHKILKHERKLLKKSKQNILKYFENEERYDSIISLASVPINSEEGITPKSPDHDQGDKVRTDLCIKAKRFNKSFDVHPLNTDSISTSAISNFPNKSADPVEMSDNITVSCESSSIVMSLLQDCIKKVSSDTGTGINDSSNNLTNSITKKQNSTENKINLAKEESNYHNFCFESLKKPKTDLSPNSVQTKNQCINQNGDIRTAKTMKTQDLKYTKDTIQTITSDSLLTKDKTFQELKVSLQLLPDNLLTLDKINLKRVISSSSVKPANNQCSDPRSLKRPKHEVSKSKHKILKHKNKLLKKSKQNILKYSENEGSCDSIISLASVPIKSKEGIIPKSPDHDQGNKIRTDLCIEAGSFSTSFDVPLSADPIEMCDNITVSCESSSVVMSLLQDCIKKVSSDTGTVIKDSSNNLTNSITKKVNSTENKINLTKVESNYHNYCNISFKKPVVVLERLNLVLPEKKCEGMNVQTPNKRNLQIGDKSHSQSTSGKVQKVSNKNAKLKYSLQKEFKILKKKKKIEKKLASSKFGSRDLAVNNLCKDDVPLLLFANKKHLKGKKYSTSHKKIKNKSKSFKRDKKFSKFDSKELSLDIPCEEDLPLLLFANNNHKKKQNYFTYKKMVKNKYKSCKRAKNFSKFDSKDLSMDNLSSKFNSMDFSLDTVSDVEDDLPLMSFANKNHVKKPNYFDFKKRTKNKSKSFKKKISKFLSKKKIKNKSGDRNPSNLKTVTMDHSYFYSPSLMNVVLDSDLSISSPLTNIERDHNYVSCIPNVVQSLEMSANHVNVPSESFKKSKKENSEKKIECPTCLKMDNPHVFLKTYLNKFCASFDDLGKVDQKNQSDIETAKKNQEYGYNYIINKLHTHLEGTCSVKESYKKQCQQNVKSASLDTSENNIAPTSDIQVSSANDSFTSFLHSETANEENNYDLSEMLFDAKKSSNNQHRSKSRVDKYRLGFLAANNPLRLYNKCLASERYLLSKYEMTEGQRKKLKKMFTSMKNNAAAIEKIV